MYDEIMETFGIDKGTEDDFKLKDILGMEESK